MRLPINHPRDYCQQYLLSKGRYTARYPRILFPSRVTLDPVYPTQVAIVELPRPVTLTGPRLYWDATRFSHRLPIHRPDMLGFFAVLSVGESLHRLRVSVAFTGDEVFKIYHKWLCLIDRQGKKLFHPPPPQAGSYEAHVVNVKQQLLFADHATLRELFQGIQIG